MIISNTDRPGSQLLTVKTPWKPLIIRALIAAVLVAVGGVVVCSLGNFEMPLSEKLNSLHHGFIGALGNVLYGGLEPSHAIVIAIVIAAIVLIVSRNLRTVVTFAATVALVWLPIEAIKEVFKRARPDVNLLSFPYHPVQLDPSYPSGHMAFIAVLIVVLVTMIASERMRLISWIVGGVLIAIAAFLLTVDAVHYPTDVLASILWVIGVTPLARAFWVRMIMPRLPIVGHER